MELNIRYAGHRSQAQTAVKTFTERAENGVREYELGKAEWLILEQLRDVLKVSWQSPDVLKCSITFLASMHADDVSFLDSKGCDALLLSFNAEPVDDDPGHGSH
jgi:hypothetical protein